MIFTDSQRLIQITVCLTPGFSETLLKSLVMKIGRVIYSPSDKNLDILRRMIDKLYKDKIEGDYRDVIIYVGPDGMDLINQMIEENTKRITDERIIIRGTIKCIVVK